MPHPVCSTVSLATENSTAGEKTLSLDEQRVRLEQASKALGCPQEPGFCPACYEELMPGFNLGVIPASLP